ncbi:MAG: tetratricopeptide repeat protein [Oligoflexia bacterium]|nr:tetratricopeptide repeat protein [Oligoflexia bacterium]
MVLYNPRLIKKLEKELKKDPQSKTFCVLAQIYYKQGEMQKAKSVCLQGLEYHPRYSQAYVLLAEIYYKENELTKAVKLLNQAKELNPENPHIYKNLAQIYKKQKQPEKALNAYKMLAFLSSNDSTAISSIQHLEKILRPSLIVPSEREELSKEEGNVSQSKNESVEKVKLSQKQNKKLMKLNQILARVENYIEQMA